MRTDQRIWRWLAGVLSRLSGRGGWLDARVLNRLFDRGSGLDARVLEHLLLHGWLLPVHCAAEVPEPFAQRAAHFGQALGSEDQERDHEDEEQMCWLENVSDHGHEA